MGFRRRSSLRAEGCSLVLDVGGGTGTLSRLLTRRKIRTVVADLSSHVSRAPGFAVRADVAGLPFHDGTFDGAAALRTLHHVPEPIEALTEVSRVFAPAVVKLRRGGCGNPAGKGVRGGIGPVVGRPARDASRSRRGRVVPRAAGAFPNRPPGGSPARWKFR
ncbi:class I SAM-dependent methyltransferase [Amycolatopsis sp. cmx-11-51]|uniref:class I SAM-dependent methyltransferase n=1 Tax=unclassified Amycolatopsis TaxID=2618356 RepID=UPI0039E2F603